MKFLVVAAAFLAVASAAPGLLGSTVVAGPSGTIVSNPGYVASSPLLAAPGLIAARSIVSPLGLGLGLAHPGLIAPGLVSAYSAPAILAAPGQTAGIVSAPGTTLIGPNTNGAPGAVVTNTIFGQQILV